MYFDINHDKFNEINTMIPYKFGYNYFQNLNYYASTYTYMCIIYIKIKILLIA